MQIPNLNHIFMLLIHKQKTFEPFPYNFFLRKGKQVSIDSDRKKSDTDPAQFAQTLHNVRISLLRWRFALNTKTSLRLL